jgi:hypothetical protein
MLKMWKHDPNAIFKGDSGARESWVGEKCTVVRAETDTMKSARIVVFKDIFNIIKALIFSLISNLARQSVLRLQLWAVRG